MKTLKKFVALLLAAALVLSLSGCSLNFSPFDNLLRPPKLSGKYQGLQDSFENNVDKGYSLSTPENGSFRSAFIAYDFDNDKSEEAIVFYTVRETPDLVKIFYFEFRDGEWVPVSSYDGLGSSVDEVKVADLNYDGKSEIIICWNLFSSKTNKQFSVYDISDGKFNFISSFPYTMLKVFDVNGDGIDDIFTMNIDLSAANENTACATAYTYDGKGKTLATLGTVKTDGNISSYANAQVEKNEDARLIFVEANKGENDMITEIIYWDDETNTLTAPLFDVSTQSTQQTLRHNKIMCCDIDKDGYLEIPVSVDMPGSSFVDDTASASALKQSGETATKSIYYTKWVKFRDNRLRSVCYSVVDDTSGYVLKVPSSWVGRITVLGRDGQWDFYRWNSYEKKVGDLLFSVYSYDKNDTAAKEKYKDAELLTSYVSTTYVYSVTQEGYKFGVKDETLVDNFDASILGGK